jgi:hypothetical protein
LLEEGREGGQITDEKEKTFIEIQSLNDLHARGQRG